MLQITSSDFMSCKFCNADYVKELCSDGSIERTLCDLLGVHNFMTFTRGWHNFFLNSIFSFHLHVYNKFGNLFENFGNLFENFENLNLENFQR